MKFTAVGDILIQKKINEDYKGFEQLTPFIERGDARFFNLETTINEEGECFASQFSGGTYLRTSKKVFESLKGFKFNMTSFNNNHLLDFSYEGLYNTYKTVEESGLVHSGVGYNLSEASAPRYLQTENGRVALISVNTSFDPSMMAGKQTSRVKGRPGINGLRIDEKIIVTEEELEFIKGLAKRTGVNCEKEIDIKSGYELAYPDNEAFFGNVRFVAGDCDKQVLTVKQKDSDRVLKAIEEAKWAADEVLISIHTHQLDGMSTENIPEFVKKFAHDCIDAGATAIIGHGPHLLRGIEVYKECPIFYSLGDFVLQLYDVELAPADFYDKYGVSSDESVYNLLKKRSKDFTIGLMEDPKMSEAVIPYWERENGKLKCIELLPVKACMSGNKAESGLPFIAEDQSFMERLDELSKPLGTRIVKNNNIYICKWNKEEK